MADVFVSFKRENRAEVDPIVRALRAAGISVWWDQDIAPDAPWEATIEAEHAAAKAVIVAWSKAAVASENVKAEARRARAQGKLLQIFVERCEPPLFFGERQGVEIFGFAGDTADPRFQKLLSAVRAVLSGSRPPEGVGYAARQKSALLPVLTGGLLLAMLAAGLVLADVGGLRTNLFGQPATSTAGNADTLDQAGLVPVDSSKPAASAPGAVPSTPAPAAGEIAPPAYVGTWRDTALGSIALILDAEGKPVCHGAMVEGRRAISLAACRGDRVVKFSHDGLRPSHPARVRRHGAITLFEFDEAEQTVWPSFRSANAATVPGDVHAYYFTDLGQQVVEPPPCRIEASGGAMRSTCADAELPGAPLFNAGGHLVALSTPGGTIVTLDQIRADLIALSVPTN